MAKDHHLDVAVQSIGGASDKLDQAAQQQVDEREEHGGNLPREKRPDPTTSLAAAMITGFCALQALHRIVLVRLRWSHPPTIDYVARRTAEGRSKREIIRCLKRYVAREVYRALTDVRADASSPA